LEVADEYSSGAVGKGRARPDFPAGPGLFLSTDLEAQKKKKKKAAGVPAHDKYLMVGFDFRAII